MWKIIDEERVYIPLSELDSKIVDNIPSDKIVKNDKFGNLITEHDLNILLLADNNLLRKNGGYPELTKVSSLKCKINDIISLRPLKNIFLLGMGFDKEEALIKIQQEDRDAIEKEAEKLRTAGPDLSERYRKIVCFLNDNQTLITDVMDKCGLVLQFITEINKNKIPNLICFIAGENVFYEIYLSDWDTTDFERFTILKDNSIVIPEPQEYEGTIIYPVNLCNNTARDFRNYTALENIIWCIQNLPVRNDFTDEVNCKYGGIYFSVNIQFLMKLINPKSFPEYLYLNGIFKIDETKICAE